MEQVLKAGIVTITNGTNYGNRLQNYALQTKLGELGIDAYTLRWRNYRDLKPVRRWLSDSKYVIKRVLHLKVTDRGRRLRRRRFREFNREFIRFGREVLEDNMAPDDVAERYEVFVCGSDQIWNTKFAFVKHDINNYLASFARPEQRVAYAASFGTNEVPKEFRDEFAAELKKFRSIGIREDAGCDIARELTGRDDIVRVPDPVLLLKREQWEQAARKPEGFDTEGRFIVTYFLGGRDEKMREYLKGLSERYDARVINLEAEFLKDAEIADMNLFSAGPCEFVWLIEHAVCVVADSFHATAFALLFGKEFAVFERRAREEDNNMGSRMTTLLKTYGVEQFLGSIDEPSVVPGPYDTEAVAERIAEERALGDKYLRGALL